jgi:hypothetical protein
MSTYSNNPQQNKWEIWFLSSVTIFIVILIIITSIPLEQLPIWYDALTLASFINLIYCIIIGSRK